MCYLASAADILAGSEGKQRRSRWARLGSDFQMGFCCCCCCGFCLCLFLHTWNVWNWGMSAHSLPLCPEIGLPTPKLTMEALTGGGSGTVGIMISIIEMYLYHTVLAKYISDWQRDG